MACEGSSHQFLLCKLTTILLLGTFQLQTVVADVNASGGALLLQECPRTGLQRKGPAMMQTSTILQSAAPLQYAQKRHNDIEDKLNMELPSSRIADPFFGLQDAFDDEHAVEGALFGAASTPTVSVEWLSLLWTLCIDAIMGGFGAASLLYLRASLSRAKLVMSAKKKKQHRLLDDGKEAAHDHSIQNGFKAAASVPDSPAVLRPDACDDWGCSALHCLAAAGDWENIKELLQQQHVEIDAREAWEETPLHLAARAGHVEVCKLLLGHGADINAMGLGGETPLIVAAKNAQEAVCQLLLLHGAGCGGLHDDELPDLLVKMIYARMLPQKD